MVLEGAPDFVINPGNGTRMSRHSSNNSGRIPTTLKLNPPMPAPTKPPTNGKHNDPEQLMPHAQLPLRNPGLEKPTGAAKRSYVSTTGSSSSAKAEVPGTCNTARTSATEARELVDVKPSLHQARTTKTARCPPAVSNAVKADQRPAASASLSSIKFKKNAPPANQNENGTTKSGLTSLLPANQNKDGARPSPEAQPGTTVQEKEAYNRSSEFKELGYQDNPYLRGEARFDFSPHTGERERQDHRVSQIHDQKATDENRFRKSTAHENQDKVVRNPRYFGNSYIPNFVYERNRNNNYRVAGGSASNV
ncbi:hypothetical protein PSTT_15014 [Puccinia striiformis]|uniref:Uncharacterized protein n=1 Tax=Puccinia striiformis TaxID=27350 RepID=A0A2S4UJQ1_9BASI|nr:hypothetical protein PSTT_15014 [Puccinia striiformis]